MLGINSIVNYPNRRSSIFGSLSIEISFTNTGKQYDHYCSGVSEKPLRMPNQVYPSTFT